MNYAQLHAKAQAECADLKDDQVLQIRLAAAAADSGANACFNILSDWAVQAAGRVSIIRTGSFGYGDLEPMLMIAKQEKHRYGMYRLPNLLSEN